MIFLPFIKLFNSQDSFFLPSDYIPVIMLYFIITTISILYNKKQKVFIFATASALHYETINHVQTCLY